MKRGTELAAEQGLGNCSFQVMDALHMDFPDYSFDLVWACESGEHMPDKKAYIEEMTRVLKPGEQTSTCKLYLAWDATTAFQNISACECYNEAVVAGPEYSSEMPDVQRAIAQTLLVTTGWRTIGPFTVM